MCPRLWLGLPACLKEFDELVRVSVHLSVYVCPGLWLGLPACLKEFDELVSVNVYLSVCVCPGLWLGLPACLKEFDELVSKFFETDSEGRPNILRQAQEMAAGLTEDEKTESAEMYVKTMQKIVVTGGGHVGREMKRLKGLRDGKVSDKKKEHLGRRLNVLESFQLRMKEEL